MSIVVDVVDDGISTEPITVFEGERIKIGKPVTAIA